MNIETLAIQPSFPALCPVTDALRTLASASAADRAAVFTRREVVDFMLDLIGYHASEPLHQRRALEPSFGEGDFLIPMIERLLDAWKVGSGSIAELSQALRGVELHHASFQSTRDRVVACLSSAGLRNSDINTIIDEWLIHNDYLLAEIDTGFDFVIGNPPYIRQEMIADVLMVEYRSRYKTIYDRADIYIPFIERSLKLLNKGGHLCFICADRWMKNRYGGPLRALVSRDFHLKSYVDMVDTPAFHSEVVAYPAITVIAREKGNVTRMASRPVIEQTVLTALADRLRSQSQPIAGSEVREAVGVASGSEPWILDSSDQLALLRRLEETYPALEDAGCKVGIGVATGADRAFIDRFEDLDVEEDRKIPIAMTRDIQSGQVNWRGYGVINPFGDDGKLVPLTQYPRLARYLEARREQIERRHIAQKAPTRWYRTIDRIYPELATEPKLLIPDIKGEAHIVYEGGTLYPHHNLYYITSTDWDLHALQAVLKSGIARLFVATYSTKMRGGYLRFQAQYLRRIRLPYWNTIPVALKDKLIRGAISGDLIASNEAAFDVYGLTAEERAILGGVDTTNGA
ncbi:Eco57I restriction-modification methylase domain-containing protein [Falsirhodobacter sp. 20TX0035]|uniref:Eco57I restriction-modification methylase domain-containing protein n=1 Tax=Falsirhodobacter sp. 20TX0035 TaxID=3022019 RepID=UPI00232BE947|nr:Eco57I restriction-modification methylase domain-containing protein [Falsirhodobacter sp. 20TX0035]MDB6454199.1 Eco57I restriction-modification methylase domain-containing protein [Falsirhodobacter sp. 20TX0035]